MVPTMSCLAFNCPACGPLGIRARLRNLRHRRAWRHRQEAALITWAAGLKATR